MGHGGQIQSMNDNVSASSSVTMKPDYAGGSILNLAAAIAQQFGVDTGHRPLSHSLPFDGAAAVVLLIVDALGYYQLQHHLAGGDLPVLERLLARNEVALASATSTFPSTTPAALTTLHTARAPAEHGLLGFTIWLEDLQTIAQTLLFRDILASQPLANPRQLMTVPSLYQQLAPARVSSRVIVPASIDGSRLSQWHFAGAETRPYRTLDQMPGLVANALDGTQPRYVVAYWPDYDTACHVHGPTSPEAGRTVHAFDSMLGTLLDALPTRNDLLLLLTADHGQRVLDPAEAIVLSDDPELVFLLASPPLGERCARYFRVQSGMEMAATDHLSSVAEVTPMADVWANGFFSNSPEATAFRSRTGDLLAIPHDHRQLHWEFAPADHGEIYRGGHGGWTASEMLVPIIAIRC